MEFYSLLKPCLCCSYEISSYNVKNYRTNKITKRVPPRIIHESGFIFNIYFYVYGYNFQVVYKNKNIIKIKTYSELLKIPTFTWDIVSFCTTYTPVAGCLRDRRAPYKPGRWPRRLLQTAPGLPDQVYRPRWSRQKLPPVQKHIWSLWFLRNSLYLLRTQFWIFDHWIQSILCVVCTYEQYIIKISSSSLSS